MVKKFDYAETVAESQSSAEAWQATAYLTVTKVIRESVPLRVRKGFGETIGQMIDSHIENCITHGEEVQLLALEFSPEQWQLMTIR